jgi:hypothetical protein
MELSVRGATNTYTNNGPNSGDTEMALDMQARNCAEGHIILRLVPRPSGTDSSSCHLAMPSEACLGTA